MGYVGNQTSTSYTSMDKQTITGSGATAYTLSHSVSSESEIEVFVNNIRQEGGSGKAYTVSGTTITFTESITSSDECYVVFQGKAIQTVVPPDGSVTSAKLATNIQADTLYGKTTDGDSGINLATNDTVKFDIAGSTKWTLNSSGNLFPAATSQGICFGVTSDTTSNRLDDYEEGTWTPLIIGSGSAGTGVYSTQTGTYTKIGRTVTFEFALTWTNFNSGSGYINIGGFPFNAASQTYYVVQTEGITLGSDNIAITARIAASDNKGLLINSPTGGGDRAAIALDTTGAVNGSGTYQTS